MTRNNGRGDEMKLKHLDVILQTPEPAGNSQQSFYFSSRSFWITNATLFLFWSLYSCVELLKGGFALPIGLFLLGVLLILIRIAFVNTRVVRSVLVDQINNNVQVKFHWPSRHEKIINLDGLSKVDTYLTISRFPYAVIRMDFMNKPEILLTFRPDSKSTSFFSTPEEVIPDSILNIAAIISNQKTREEQ